MVAEPDETDTPAEAADFFRTEYRGLHAMASYLGATDQEAHDAVMAAMSDLVRKWTELKSPRAYARRCVLNEFIKGRTRERSRLERLVQRRAVSSSSSADEVGFGDWEGREWVMQKIRALPRSQREVLALIVDGMTPAEAAEILGKNGDAVRQSLLEARRQLTRDLQGEGYISPRTSVERMERKEAK